MVDQSLDQGSQQGAQGVSQAQVIANAASALAAAVQSLSEITAKMNQMMDSVSENVKKQSQADDRSLSTELSGGYDIYANMQRTDAYRDLALSQALRHSDALAMRALDHFSALPPIAAKPQGC